MYVGNNKLIISRDGVIQRILGDSFFYFLSVVPCRAERCLPYLARCQPSRLTYFQIFRLVYNKIDIITIKDIIISNNFCYFNIYFFRIFELKISMFILKFYIPLWNQKFIPKAKYFTVAKICRQRKKTERAHRQRGRTFGRFGINAVWRIQAV